MHRHLFDLARQGLGFPRVDTFRTRGPVPVQKFPSVKIRARRAFYAGGRLLEAGEVVVLAEPDAAEAVALGRASRL